MTKHGEGGRLISIRLHREALAAVDEIAEQDRQPRSVIIRRLLSEALTARKRRAARR